MGSSVFIQNTQRFQLQKTKFFLKTRKTNDAYAIAKITGLKMADALIKQKWILDVLCLVVYLD